MNELRIYANQYRDELLESVVPFWLNNSRDNICASGRSIGDSANCIKILWGLVAPRL